MPLIIASPPARSLLLCEKNASVSSACVGGFHGNSVRRTRPVIMMNVVTEYCAPYQGLDHLWQKQVRDSGQLISARRMSSDFNSKGPQLLHQAPYFRTRCADLLRQLGSANHGSGVIHQHANDSSQTNIRLMFGVVCRRYRPRT